MNRKSKDDGKVVGCINQHYTHSSVHPGFETSFSIQIAENMTDPTTGVCAVEACKDRPWGNCKIDCGNSLFTAKAIKMQLDMCGMKEDCSDPPGYDPPNGPEDACQRAGVSMSDAEAHCGTVLEEFKQGCIVDFCTGGGDPDIHSPSTPTPPAPVIESCVKPTPTFSPTTAPTAPTPAPPTPTP